MQRIAESPPPALQRPVIDQMREALLFAELEDAVLRRLAEITEAHVVEAGTRLFEQGDSNPPLWVLVSGQMSLFRTASDGTVTVVEVVQPSGHAGLTTILTQLPIL